MKATPRNSVIVGSALIALTMLLFGFSGVDAQGATDDPARVDAGQAVYTASCATCHGADGMGTSRGRPLIGVADQGDRARHIESVTDGRGGMPSFGGSLSAEEIEDSVSFVRLTFVAAPEPTPTPEPTAVPEPEPEAEASDSDAADATASSGEDELAFTGAETQVLAALGVVLIAGGATFVTMGRRRQA